MPIVYEAVKYFIGWTVAVLAIALALAIGGWPAGYAVTCAIVLARWWDAGKGVWPSLKEWLAYIATCPRPFKVSVFFLLLGFGGLGIPLLVLLAVSVPLIGNHAHQSANRP